MARSFGGATHRLVSSATGFFPATGSIAWWVRPNWVSADGANHIFFSADADTNPVTATAIRAQKFSDNNLYIGWYDSGTPHRVVVTSGSYTLNQSAWNLFIFTWDDTANDQRLYLNNAEIGSNNTMVAHTTGVLTLGNTSSAVADVNMDGALAEVSLWDKVLPAGDRSSLWAGASSFLVAPASLVSNWPLWGTHSPEPDRVGGAGLTVTGATALQSFPRISSSRRPKFFRAAAAAGWGMLLSSKRNRLVHAR